MPLRTVSDVAAELRVSEWTIAGLVRNGKVDCLRVSTTGSKVGPIRFTDDQFRALVESLTVAAVDPGQERRRRRRRA